MSLQKLGDDAKIEMARTKDKQVLRTLLQKFIESFETK